MSSKKGFGSLALAHCGYSKDGLNFTFQFHKASLTEEFFDVEPGIVPRVQLAQKMFKEDADKERQKISSVCTAFR